MNDEVKIFIWAIIVGLFFGGMIVHEVYVFVAIKQAKTLQYYPHCFKHENPLECAFYENRSKELLKKARNNE